MARVTGRCPNCSAPVEFAWASSVQTVCSFCRSIVVRHDLDLSVVGKVSDPPVDSSPIQIGTAGRVGDLSFTVTGRIVYEYENGGWNEWHLNLESGASWWLSDAMAEYAVSRAVQPPEVLPRANQLEVGRTFEWEGDTYRVTTLTKARYRAVEGELPFEYWGKHEVMFADLRTSRGGFGTIDYSQKPPLLYLGQFYEYEDLHLSNVRRFEGWPI